MRHDLTRPRRAQLPDGARLVLFPLAICRLLSRAMRCRGACHIIFIFLSNAASSAVQSTLHLASSSGLGIPRFAFPRTASAVISRSGAGCAAGGASRITTITSAASGWAASPRPTTLLPRGSAGGRSLRASALRSTTSPRGHSVYGLDQARPLRETMPCKRYRPRAAAGPGMT